MAETHSSALLCLHVPGHDTSQTATVSVVRSGCESNAAMAGVVLPVHRWPAHRMEPAAEEKERHEIARDMDWTHDRRKGR